MDLNDRLLSKGLLEARKHSENPILKNIQGGIYKSHNNWWRKCSTRSRQRVFQHIFQN